MVLRFLPRRSFTTATRSAAFSHHVAHIVRLRPKKKMVRPNASRDIAVMQHEQSRWNWAVGQFPREAMHQYRFGAFSPAYRRIAIGAFRDMPEPTSVRLYNLLPESFGWFGNTALSATESTFTTYDAVVRLRESHSAVFACKLYSHRGCISFGASPRSCQRRGGTCVPIVLLARGGH